MTSTQVNAGTVNTFTWNSPSSFVLPPTSRRQDKHLLVSQGEVSHGAKLTRGDIARCLTFQESTKRQLVITVLKELRLGRCAQYHRGTTAIDHHDASAFSRPNDTQRTRNISRASPGESSGDRLICKRGYIAPHQLDVEILRGRRATPRQGRLCNLAKSDGLIHTFGVDGAGGFNNRSFESNSACACARGMSN